MRLVVLFLANNHDINENLRNLLHSIEERGIDEPLIVRRVNDKLEIIS